MRRFDSDPRLQRFHCNALSGRCLMPYVKLGPLGADGKKSAQFAFGGGQKVDKILSPSIHSQVYSICSSRGFSRLHFLVIASHRCTFMFRRDMHIFLHHPDGIMAQDSG